MKYQLIVAAFLFVMLAGLFSSCNKNGAAVKLTDCDKYYIDLMEKKWGEKENCGDIYSTLSKGTYNGELVYFAYVDGDGLAYTSVAPLGYVVNCNKDSIKLSGNSKIENVTVLAKSCK